MLQKLTALPVLAFIVLVEPLQAIAQQAAPQPPPVYYGPGHMWSDGYGGHGFWMFPLMLLLLGLVWCSNPWESRGPAGRHTFS